MALYRLESAFEWRSTQNILRVEIRKVAKHLGKKSLQLLSDPQFSTQRIRETRNQSINPSLLIQR